MSTTGAPQIPPRPTRVQNKAPEIPPRPLPKRMESPSRNNYPSSPFNEPLGRTRSQDIRDAGLPQRPPSVTLPSIGQEGNEYADIQYEESNPLRQIPSNASSTQTRHIGGNLPMHAPKPSLPSAAARAQIQTVTRTDSSQAAAHGIGPHEGEPLSRLKSKSSFSRPGSSSSFDRRSSMQFDEDHGPAELGLRVPINPNLGDVQAPSPAPESFITQGHVDRQRKHNRTKSGRDILPHDSYGLHGHGLVPMDKFDRDWYAKHPDELTRAKEEGYYHGIGSGRGEAALSSEELNRLVRSTPSRGAGFGTSGAIPAYPDEQVGYLASEVYSSRTASPATAGGLYKTNSNPSQPSVVSPLRKTSFPADITGKEDFEKSGRPISSSDMVMESETEDESIHINDPNRKYNKVTGGQESLRETEDLGPDGGNHNENGGYGDENGYGVPILASDEVAKEAGAEYMQPAVPPHRERRGSSEYLPSGEQTPWSRPSSRPSSMHGGSGLSRFITNQDEHEHIHTPLEDVEEYEPLFPEDESGTKKPLNAADRFKTRPDTLKHRFPSQDIWEDAPTSQLHVATVSTPDLSNSERSAQQTSTSTFESPEQEKARKGEVDETERAKLIPKGERLAMSKFAPHLRDDMPTRPGMQNRFPSQDIWEDSPESHNLVTIVGTPPSEDIPSPTDSQSKPTIPQRPVDRSKLGLEASEPSVPPTQPSIPARPPKRLHQVPPADATLTSTEKPTSPTESKKAPSLPDRPKPQIPTRPATKEVGENLTKTTSATSAGSAGSNETAVAQSQKAKPVVPARPAGSKIASLRAGFLEDLNKRLGTGPAPPPKKEEPAAEVDTEKATLSDARKGRARGPQRRKPAASPSGAAESTPSAPSFKIFAPQSLWHISNEDGRLTVHGHEEVPDVSDGQRSGDSGAVPKAAEAQEQTSSEAPSSLAPPLALNTAGGSTDPAPLSTADATPKSERSNPLDKSPATLGKLTAESSHEPAAPSPLTNAIIPDLTDPEEVEGAAKPEVASESPLMTEKALEEMTASADGKQHAPEEAGSPP